MRDDGFSGKAFGPPFWLPPHPNPLPQGGEGDLSAVVFPRPLGGEGQGEGAIKTNLPNAATLNRL